eukprot:jgi/Tetstr1/465187/TSEL_000859.t1
MHHSDTFALYVVRERYRHLGTKNMGLPEFTELLKPYTRTASTTTPSSAAKMTARQRFGGALRRNDRGRDGGGTNCDNFTNASSPGREAAAPRATFAKDVPHDYGKSKAKAVASAADKVE